METEPTAPRGSRPRPILLALLGVAVVALLLLTLMPSGSATPRRTASNQPRTGAAPGLGERLNPQDLDLRLEGLSAARPEPSATRRNPFRFEEPKPPPVPSDAPMMPRSSDSAPSEPVETTPAPPPVPPIPLKFIGFVEGQGKKLVALSDCKFTYRGEEGEIIDGRYRLVRIGVESVEMEYLDGRGRTKIRLSGQDCVGR